MNAPLDLAAVQADDALLDSLRSPECPGERGPDAWVTRALLAWRRELDAAPLPRLVDVETALALVGVCRRRDRWLVPVAAAAAVLVIALSAVGLAARTAGPGDGLWPVTEVLYPARARAVCSAGHTPAPAADEPRTC